MELIQVTETCREYWFFKKTVQECPFLQPSIRAGASYYSKANFQFGFTLTSLSEDFQRHLASLLHLALEVQDQLKSLTMGQENSIILFLQLEASSRLQAHLDHAPAKLNPLYLYLTFCQGICQVRCPDLICPIGPKGRYGSEPFLGARWRVRRDASLDTNRSPMIARAMQGQVPACIEELRAFDFTKDHREAERLLRQQLIPLLGFYVRGAWTL